MDHPGPLFRLFCLLKELTNPTTNKCEKMSIQYSVLGFELTIFGTRVSSHYLLSLCLFCCFKRGREWPMLWARKTRRRTICFLSFLHNGAAALQHARYRWWKELNRMQCDQIGQFWREVCNSETRLGYSRKLFSNSVTRLGNFGRCFLTVWPDWAFLVKVFSHPSSPNVVKLLYYLVKF